MNFKAIQFFTSGCIIPKLKPLCFIKWSKTYYRRFFLKLWSLYFVLYYSVQRLSSRAKRRRSKRENTNKAFLLLPELYFQPVSASAFLEIQSSQQTCGSCDVGLAVVCVCSAPLRQHKKLSNIPSFLPSHCRLSSPPLFLVTSAGVFSRW